MNLVRRSGEYAPELKVIESAGGPRTGKGTITKHLGQAYPGAATDETGADYRAVTLGLIKADLLDADMDQGAVKDIVEHLDARAISDLAARRYEIIASFGEAALYETEVSKLVGLVSPDPKVRVAIKAGVILRIEKLIDEGTTLLIVDGRNLGPLIEKIERARLILRLFVDCEVPVAVLREAARKGIDLSHGGDDEWFQKEFDLIKRRRILDESRDEDPAKPDENRINYWYNTDINTLTVQRYAEQTGLSFSQAMYILKQPANIRKGGRIGAGRLAYETGRQVYFDTTEIGVDEMRDYAKRMADEALDAHSASMKLA